MIHKSIGTRPKGSMKYVGGLSTLFSFSKVLQRNPHNVYMNVRDMHTMYQPDKNPLTDYGQSIGYITNLVNGQLVPLLSPVTYLPSMGQLTANLGSILIPANTPMHNFVDTGTEVSHQQTVTEEELSLDYQVQIQQGTQVLYLFGKYSNKEIEQIKNTLLLSGNYVVPEFSPKHLFLNGEQGLYIDPANLDTLYQDALMQQKVTANGQTISIAIDNIYGEQLSENLWDFSKLSVAGESTVDVVNQTINVKTTDGSVSQVSCGTGVAGALYEVSFEIISISGRVAFDFLGTNSISTVGKHTFRAVSSSAALTFMRSGVMDAVIGNISVRRIGQLNAYQVNSASKPIYRDGYLETDGIDDFLTLPVFQLPQPFTVMIAIETVKLSGTQALFSSGQSGYLLMTTSGTNLSTQQNSGNPAIYQPKSTKDVLMHATNNSVVKLKTNIGELQSTEIVHNNPYYTASQKYIANFNASTFTTAAGIKLYAMLVINRALTDEEEAAVRKAFNKRMGIKL